MFVSLLCPVLCLHEGLRWASRKMINSVSVVCIIFVDFPCSVDIFFNLFPPVSRLQDAAADALSKFYYPPVAAVTVSYPKEAIRSECLIDGELKGFGQLHPRSQGVETLGILL